MLLLHAIDLIVGRYVLGKRVGNKQLQVSLSRFQTTIYVKFNDFL